MPDLRVVAPFEPSGDQPQAILELSQGIEKGIKYQTLMGATGTGKTYTISKVIESVQKPTIVLSHNKTLAAQLYGEFKAFFPDNAVEYFISYYDYYQPEAYKPTTDTFIEKEVDINDEINRLRLRATSMLQSRKDVIIVASVSCIYGIGNPDEYDRLHVHLKKGEEIDRDAMLRKLVDIHFTRNDLAFDPGTFRVRGDVVEIRPMEQELAVRVELWGDEVENISMINILTGEVVEETDEMSIYPAKHFVASGDRIERAILDMEVDLALRLEEFRTEGKLLEAQRLETRTRYDIEMMHEIGFCPGIENYSRYIDGRQPGERPYVLLDFFDDDYLMVIDESHVTMPQVRGMWKGDRTRKETLVEHGFRLPAAIDNRPLYHEEFEEMINQVVFMSATPSDYEMEKAEGVIVEQILRPTGVLDPLIEVRPVRGQVDDLVEEAQVRIAKHERVLVTTLTKRMSEDLADYMRDIGIKARYMHSEIDSLDRVEIIRDLRLGKFDVLIGVNLLREGLDMPEVSLVAVLDADKEGFLRSGRSLIQTAGRAARNVNGVVIMYGDKVTDSMQDAIDVTNRRRKIQDAYNKENGIVPRTVLKSDEEIMQATRVTDDAKMGDDRVAEGETTYESDRDPVELIADLEKRMTTAAAELDFETAAKCRDEIVKVKEKLLQ